MNNDELERRIESNRRMLIVTLCLVLALGLVSVAELIILGVKTGLI